MTLNETVHAPNRGIFWAKTFIDELARCGLEAVCIAPGSRSTPLVIACADNPRLRVYSHIDERSAAFFALGLAQASGKPVAIISSSGTATANFHPAVIEAKYAGVPLLILTADRPPELRDSGANQTIDQIKLYGDHVLWSVDAALPEAEPPAVAVRALRTLACRAYALAAGLPAGPVHINFPFRKPLEPIPVAGDYGQLDAPSSAPPLTRIVRGVLQPFPPQLDQLAAIIADHPRGWIVCGPTCPGGDFPGAVAALARASGYPILADPLSGVRFHPDSAAFAVGGYDTFLMGDMPDIRPPQVVVRFGAVPTSRWLNEYLDRIQPAHRLHIRASGVWADDAHRTSLFVQADETAVCQALARMLESGGRSAPPLLHEAITWQTFEQEFAGGAYFDGAVLADVVECLPEDAALFVGNSLPVRHLDQFARPAQKRLRVFANRGASGIDGVVSSALGAAAARLDQPLVLVIGDLSFYHDMNGLLAARRGGIQNITIVLLNNDGGGIFHRLPIKDFDPPFTELFVTPHGLDFQHAARLYALEYWQADERSAFRQALTACLKQPGAHLIEVRTDARRDLKRRAELVQAVRTRLAAVVQPEV